MIDTLIIRKKQYEIGMMFYNARFYDPAIAHFAQADTLIPDQGSAIGYNRYAYVAYNPMKYTDPSGHRPAGECEEWENCSTPSSGSDPEPDLDDGGEDWPEDIHPTEYLVKEMTDQASILKELDNGWMRSCAASYFYSSYCGISYEGYLYSSHDDMFSTDKYYDIKQGMMDANVSLCGSEECRWVEASTPGNIFFGYESAARGIFKPFAYAAAGYLEIKKTGFKWENAGSWFDNPADKAAVDFGWDLFDKYGLDMTIADFQNELTMDVLGALQQPTTPPNHMPSQQPNNFPPGFFFNTQ